jgi:hypothetical protein
MATEVLPIGVGRVPKWWMECTPHYVLDLEEDEARRRAEEQMALYYAQMAAADDAGLLGPDGKPILGPDGKPLAWSGSGWAGRGSGSSSEGANGSDGPGGRNFNIKDFKIDPKMFGIEESDPDYKAYLTGAKLPPGFLDKMKEMYGSGDGNTMYNNLAQTDYGKYGRQAEKPAFQPSWMKKKLRSTSNGGKIRGSDSPKKESAQTTPHDRSAPLEKKKPEPTTPINNTRAPPPAASTIAKPEPVPPETKQVRKVRKVRRVVKKTNSTGGSKESTVTPSLPAPPPTEQMRYGHSDYYYNARPAPMPRNQPKPEPAYEPEPEPEPEPAYEPEEDYDEYDDDDYDEEILEDSDGEEANLSDLQAILAAKQAELARLQAQM